MNLWRERIRAVKIISGTFRLSIVVTSLAFSYDVWRLWQEDVKGAADAYRMEQTYKCGALNSDERLKEAVNHAGLVNLFKVGCADKQFLASFEELRDVREGKLDLFKHTSQFTWEAVSYSTLGAAVVAFVLVNVAGFLIYGARSVLLWVLSGYMGSGDGDDQARTAG
jgi:hypothetical protein